MERERFKLPLLIGGATTSKAHTAVRIAPVYSEPVVHVLDASRAVPVVGQLLSDEAKPEFVSKLRAEQERSRAQHVGQRQKLWSLPEARDRAARLAFNDLPQPAFTGAKSVSSELVSNSEEVLQVRLSDLLPFIDWSLFFHTWELRGRYPAILQHPEHGEQARQLFADAQRLLEDIVNRNRLVARGVFGFFPANAVGDDVEVYADPSRSTVRARLHFLRQQMIKDTDLPQQCLSDFLAPRVEVAGGPLPDHVGAFAVTAGHGLREMVGEFRADHDDYRAILAEALADRLAEAFAEWCHRQARIAWGYGRDESLSQEELIAEAYRGIRPAPGYPACPDHTEKQTLWELLDVERRAGISLTESYAMLPGSSVSGWYFAHPQARYFGVGQIGADQVADYARRKGMTVGEVERWLGPHLNYTPAAAR
jgi:5-methyltetrahydrofolate--homocysteine methyltransferase